MRRAESIGRTEHGVLFKTRRNKFIFVELFVALIASMIMLAMAGNYSKVRNTGAFSANALDMRRGISQGLQIILNDLLAAGYNPTGMNGVGILFADENAIRVSADRNGDGDLLDAGEDVTYAFDAAGHQINRNRNATKRAVPFATNVRNFSFSYFDGLGRRTTRPANIRKIRIHLEVGSSTDSAADRVVSEVIPRVFAKEAARLRKIAPKPPVRKAAASTGRSG